MTFQTFVRENARWLLGGLNLTFFSSLGQTFLIAMFASQIRSEFGLSHGEFGQVYMLGTLASAICLVYIGKIVDFQSIRRVSSVVIVALAGACVVMATASSVIGLTLAVFLLRLSGQGMMSHTAMTAMGRWFSSHRGRAVSVVTSGHQLGEAVFPFIIVSLMGYFGWRYLWLAGAVVLVLVALPGTLKLFAVDRTPLSESAEAQELGRQWTRREAIGDTWFWCVCLGTMTPAFIGTSVWFHQVYLLELKTWPSDAMVVGFVVLSLTSVVTTLITGQLIDKFTAHRLLPLVLGPLALGCFVLAAANSPLWLLLFMFLTGVSYGLSSSIFGAIWSEVYGTRHLGAIRAVVFAGMVFSSAVGPGLTGWLIDIGIDFDSQLWVFGWFCLAAVYLLYMTSTHLVNRVHENQATGNRSLPGTEKR